MLLCGGVQAYGEPCAYERYPGAASRPLPPTYRPRKPHETALHRVVRENLLTFLADGVERSGDGEGYPFYIEKELRSFIGCGDLSRGFARVRCGACGFEMLLPFSCKNRGLCPSCTSRRMADEAAFLVDAVLPESDYRQWTVTFPWPIRYLMAKDYKLVTAVLDVVMRALFCWQRKMARRAGHRGAKTAAVAFVHRWGSALNANLHPHILMPDAVFVSTEGNETLDVVALPPPSDEDILRITERIARRVSALIEKWFATIDDSGDGILDSALKDAMRTRVEGHPAVLVEDEDSEPDDDEADGASQRPKRSARLDGFTVHANTQIGAEDRPGLERICRYGMRPAFSVERLSLTDDGKVQYRLRKPWPNAQGTSVLTFEPVEFLRRLAALIPPPYAHLTRHFGLFAANAKDRDRLPAAPVTWTGVRPETLLRLDPKSASGASSGSRTAVTPAAAAAPSSDGDQGTDVQTTAQQTAGCATGPPPPSADRPTFAAAQLPKMAHPPEGRAAEHERPQRKPLPWAELLRRVFLFDVLVCPQCQSEMSVIAYLTDAPVLRKILTHLELPCTPPMLSPARYHEQQLDLFEGDDFVELDDEPEAPSPSQAARAPPADGLADWVVELDAPDDPDDIAEFPA